MTVQIIRSDARDLPLEDATVDLIVTSPPYFALRSYTDDGAHYAGQIGSEATPAEFLDALTEVTRECMRVLKPTGSLWVNLGDKYAQDTERSRNGNAGALDGGIPLRDGPQYTGRRTNGVPRKSLIGIPWRYALRCIDDLGLILRAEIIWSKPNGLPESVTDRVRRSHEQWFHFTKQPRYFAAVDEIREAHTHKANGATFGGKKSIGAAGLVGSADRRYGENTYDALNPLGKLPGSVWTVPTQPLTVPAHLGVDHFAAFPMEWPRRIIAGWSPTGICTACGEGRRPVALRDEIDPRYLASNARQESHERLAVRGVSSSSILRTGLQSGQAPATRITGYACACPTPDAPTTPAVVLDPFGGTGTTALVAHALGRHGISVDLSADYCRLAEWRTSDPGQLAAALQVEKPPVQVPGQVGLFDDQDGVA